MPPRGSALGGFLAADYVTRAFTPTPARRVADPSALLRGGVSAFVAVCGQLLPGPEEVFSEPDEASRDSRYALSTTAWLCSVSLAA